MAPPPLLEELNKHYESSLKAFLMALLELELSMQLVLSFFECKRLDEQDEQELQTLYTLSWEPLVMSVFLVYGHRVLPSIAPAPENEDVIMLRLKILTWVYSLLFLVWDDDMTVKTGPSLGIAIIFCFCDLARFHMEVHRLIDDYTDDEEAESDIEYAVHMLGLENGAAAGAAGAATIDSRPPSKSADSNRAASSNRGVSSSSQATPPSWNVPIREAAGAGAAPSGPVRQNVPLVQEPQQAADAAASGQRPALQPYRNKNNRYLLKKSSSNVTALDTTPSNINSEFVAVVDEREPRAGGDAKSALETKKSFVYEF